MGKFWKYGEAGSDGVNRLSSRLPEHETGRILDFSLFIASVTLISLICILIISNNTSIIASVTLYRNLN